MFGDDNQDNDKPQDDAWKHPGPPPADDAPADAADDNTGQPPTEPSTDQDDDVPANNDLIDLKRDALTKLLPLVDHLDQPADEKFRTLMMMIQASDNQRLVRQAYDAALKIDDEKERAQALLDIVNEINYFTQDSKPQ